MKHHALAQAAVLGLLAAILSGCGPTRPADLTTATVAHPGTVLVNHDARRRALETAPDGLCPTSEDEVPHRALPVLAEVDISGDDLDPRLNHAGQQMMNLAAACLRFEGRS